MEQHQASSAAAKDAQRTPQARGRVIPERAGPEDKFATSGVSDQRRAELEQLEAAAGTEHEAADESVPQNPFTGSTAGPAAELSTPTTSETSHLPRQSVLNPDIDKR